ncbi:hypothetical protein [Gilvimarinus chinensis]|uniref:hypothetical protein n=1 Tax=Gilvimarinus chinensis TaxID=396005 RepID=UPI000370AE32|nr:hypothetical protein [Gilvimarinus chinensis]
MDEKTHSLLDEAHSAAVECGDAESAAVIKMMIKAGDLRGFSAHQFLRFIAKSSSSDIFREGLIQRLEHIST